tara:strand:+ start:300 stop:524 length:225 start_codon:yes stop_codon:yes gene_type:complete
MSSNLTKSDKELIIDILSFELNVIDPDSLNTLAMEIGIWNLLKFELESMKDYPDATPFYEDKLQIIKILKKLES